MDDIQFDHEKTHTPLEEAEQHHVPGELYERWDRGDVKLGSNEASHASDQLPLLIRQEGGLAVRWAR